MTTDQLRTSTFTIPGLSRLQRNHGLEHATLHVLSETHPRLAFAGHSDTGGFWIIGNLDTDDLRAAVDTALNRLRAGESNLAIHPNCGTNLVATGALAGLAAWFGMLGADRAPRDRLERLPIVIGLSTVALLAGQPLGMFLQARVTTSGHPGDLEVVDIQSSHRRGVQAHRVLTRG